MSRATLTTFAVLATVLFAATVLVPALGVFDRPAGRPALESAREGTVTRILEAQTIRGERGDIQVRRFEVNLDGRAVVIEHSRDPFQAGPRLPQDGDRILVGVTPGPDGDIYYFADYVRRTPLWLMAALFAVLVLLTGRVQGVWSLVGMAASLLVILRFIIPGILAGHSPVLISVLGSLLIMLPALYLAHGVSRKTSVALAGTGASLLITAALAAASIAVFKLTGTAEEAVTTLQSLSEGRINPEGLLLAGIIIGALGVLDDVTVAQASTVFELRDANAGLSSGELYRRAMNVGRDHIASTVNTLVLAYAGASLPLLILLANGAEPAGTLLSREFLATEIVRTLAGSIGIVAAVPVTTALAAVAASRLAPGDGSAGGEHPHTHAGPRTATFLPHAARRDPATGSGQAEPNAGP